ncbi:MAG: bifunctional homocysteine S-methyltransferase/methylenetetrahydrofolate reductase [Lachnospiraceae bacterium]|nr:bifunctional homocysteine S-methyltransferase/methylenetetrahydrofolate reductase [Lachnospiraceae bacterium]
MNRLTEYLKGHTLFTDGAMGTYYGEKYQGEDVLVEKANILFPERIKEIHLEYLHSGARLLRTNTFAINTGFFSNREEMASCIKAGYHLAVEAKNTFLKECQEQKEKPEVFIAADIGTIYDLGQRDESEVLQEYKFMVDTFIEAGADIFLLETQSDIYYIPAIVSYIKEQIEDAFVAVTFSFDKTGYTKTGLRFERMVRRMCEMADVDAYGINCGVEAAHMYQMLEKVTFPSDKPFLALPNAGYPYQLRGKTIYGKNASYFSKMLKKIFGLGIDVIGGCCGTTPAYFAELYRELARNEKPQKHTGSLQETTVSRTESEFWKKLQNGEKPFIVELDPPSGLSVDKLFSGAELLREHRVDLLTLSDSPMARSRMDASLLGQRIQREVGIPVMPHLSCRDRNVISLRGTMLGDYINDIKHFLIVTGDPVAKTDRSSITQVFDYNSIKFMGLLQEMNEDQFAADRIVYGGALNYHGANIDAIAKRMKSKMERGCSFFLTQPIYSKEDIERIGQLREMTGAKIMGGIMPLVSRKNALFIANEMPGIRVPQEILDRYQPDMTRQEYEKVAVQVSVEIAEKLSSVVDGFYFMTPFNRVGLICTIIEEVRGQ